MLSSSFLKSNRINLFARESRLRNWIRVHPMTDNKKTNKSYKPDKKSSSSSEKKNYKPVNNKFTKDRNTSGGSFKKSAGKPSFFGTKSAKDDSESPRRSYRKDSPSNDGERKPFSRGPRREGGEGNGERKPFNRSFPRRDGEGSGERRPFDRGSRREGGEGNGERKPFNRGPRREDREEGNERKPFNRSFPRRDGESSAERKPFPRREREPFRERPVASFDGEELPEAPPEKREVRRYTIDPEEMKQKTFPKTNKKIKVRKDKEEGILQSKDDEKAALLARLKEDSITGSERNFTDGTDQTVFRINRFLAKSGLGARRDVEDYIRSGQIRVNGEEETSLSRKIDITKDTVEFNGEKVELVSDNTILALNKPEGYLCSHHDVHHDKTVFNLLPLKYKKFNMAGRLDLTSRGLMIFSANGDVLNQISHPSYDVKKRYLVQVDKPIQESDFVELFLRGVEDDGEFLRAKEVSIVDSETSTISIMLQEGKKRQIHRMFQAIGYKVVDLQRVQIGKLLLDDLDLPEGKFKEVKLEDIFG